MQEQENAKTDPLHGLRVHSWVLVLSGKREVPESFFIDPFTAHSYSTQDDHFLGIESLWNHKNYWVNMQDCWNCCKVLGGAWGGVAGTVGEGGCDQWGELATSQEGFGLFLEYPGPTSLPIHNHSSMIIVTLLVSVSL